MKPLSIFLIAAALAGLVACNPFAPAVSDAGSTTQFGDPHTFNGYFQAFQYAYQFSDTTLYGSLLANNFIFSFHDYNQGIDVQWGRDDEMSVTALLFQSTTLTLLWGDIIDAEGSPTDSTVTRAFTLNVTFNEGDIEEVNGNAVFHLQRPTTSDPWLAISWQDESTF
jgi:hypothetical protein